MYIRNYLFLSISLSISFKLLGQEQESLNRSPYDASDSNSIISQSDIVLPVGSFVFPGFGQWINGQYNYGAIYSGTAILGFSYASEAKRAANSNTIDLSDPTIQDSYSRRYQLGLQTYQSMGGYSLYHSFRTAVQSRKNSGQYSFLSRDESPIEIATAPFHFSYLKNPNTWVPLTIGAALNTWIVTQPSDGWSRKSLMAEDSAFAFGFSWNAGTYEEAVFRGWLMPVFREYWMNDSWSNGSQATLFAAAHLGTNSVPIPQLILGWHLGNVTQENKWLLSESIFIHTWWDVFSFFATYQLKKSDPESKAIARLHLPPFSINF